MSLVPSRHSVLGCTRHVNDSTPPVNLGGPLNLESSTRHASGCICEEVSGEVSMRREDPLKVLNSSLKLKEKEEEASRAQHSQVLVS